MVCPQVPRPRPLGWFVPRCRKIPIWGQMTPEVDWTSPRGRLQQKEGIMKKRVLAFLCVCVLAAGAVAGCGSQTGAAGQAGSEQTTPQTTPEVSGEHGGQTTPEVSGEPEAADEQTTPEVAEVAGIDTSVMNTNNPRGRGRWHRHVCHEALDQC